MPTSDRLNISSRSRASASSSLCCDFMRVASASTTTMPIAPGAVSCVRRSASEHQKQLCVDFLRKYGDHFRHVHGMQVVAELREGDYLK